MSTEQVSIIIRARDLATSVLRQTDRALKNIGVSARGLVMAFGAVAATATGLAYLGKKLFDVGATALETRNKFETVFGDEGRQLVQGFLDDWARMAGLSKQNAQAMTATTGAILQGLGATQQESARLSIDVTRLAGDLASFNNVGTDEVLQAINAGLTGEREQLKRLGIVLRQTDVDQRALTNSGKRSVRQLTDMDRALASVQLIAEKSGVAIGDLARTSDSAANRAKQLRAQWQDVLDDFAVQLLPTLEELIPAIADVGEAAAAAAPKLVRFLQGAADFFGLTSVAERSARDQLLADIDRLGDDLDALVAKRAEVEAVISGMLETTIPALQTKAREVTVSPRTGADMPTAAAQRAAFLLTETQAELAGLSGALDRLNTKIRTLQQSAEAAAAAAPRSPRQRLGAFGRSITVGDLAEQRGFSTALPPDVTTDLGTINRELAGQAFQALAQGPPILQGLVEAIAPYNAALEAQADLERQAADVLAATRTPQELYNLEIQRLDTLLAHGALTGETYARAVTQAKKAMDAASESAHRAAISTEQFAIAALNMAAAAAASAIEGGFSFGRLLQFGGGIAGLIPGGQVIGAGLAAAGTVVNALERSGDRPTDVMIKGYHPSALDQLRDVQGPLQVINQLIAPSTGEVVRSIEWELDRRTRLRKRTYVPMGTDFGGGG